MAGVAEDFVFRNERGRGVAGASVDEPAAKQADEIMRECLIARAAGGGFVTEAVEL
jgi:hypothetical protein